MYTFDLAAKLERLNSRLYIDTQNGRELAEGWWVSGIYLRSPERRERRISESRLGGAGRQVYDAAVAGQKDKYIAGISLTWVPEYDIFSTEGEYELLAPGWRSLVMNLVKQRLVSLDQARKVFNCSGLGEQTYDKLSLVERHDLWKKDFEDGDKYNVRF